MMLKDPIVDEVRKIREEQAEKYNYDLGKIIDQAIKRQKKSKHLTVSFVIRNRTHQIKIAQ
ncbi:hypothetical protein JW964_06435 [candidate division KSB1 bacterium]|nr:hypothetical protein [candidate division KSB1 bacterium]